MRKKVAKLLLKLSTEVNEYRNFKRLWNNTPRPEREALRIKFEKQIKNNETA
jgi:hypothetical protein